MLAAPISEYSAEMLTVMRAICGAFGTRMNSHLFELGHFAVLAARSLREEEHRGSLGQQVLAVAQTLYLAPLIHPIQLDVP